jgi:hypothetical protein
LAVPEVREAIFRGVPRRWKRIQNQFQVVGYREVDGLAAIDGPQPNAPSVSIPRDGILSKRADIGDAERSMPKQHDHRSRAELLVPGATGLCLPPPICSSQQ